MIFNEPKVEYVALDLEVTTYTASQKCPEDELYIGGTPSMETCDGPDAPGNNCKKYGFIVMDDPSKAIQSSQTKSSSSEPHQFFNSFLPPMDS